MCRCFLDKGHAGLPARDARLRRRNVGARLSTRLATGFSFYGTFCVLLFPQLSPSVIATKHTERKTSSEIQLTAGSGQPRQTTMAQVHYLTCNRPRFPTALLQLQHTSGVDVHDGRLSWWYACLHASAIVGEQTK